MRTIIRGKEVDTAILGEIRVEATDLDLAVLSAGALFALRRAFEFNARECRRYALSAAKRRVRDGIEQILAQLTAEVERRRNSESRAVASLGLIFKNVEDAGCVHAFLAGLVEVFVAERAKVMPQGELEQSILDLKSVACECSAFCRSIAVAIYQHQVEV